MTPDTTALREALETCRDYFAERADAEYFPDSPGPVPNDEMRLLTYIERVLA